MAKGVADVGLQAAGAVVPGGSVLSNAMGGAFGGASSEPNAGGITNLDTMAMNMEFLMLQQQIQNESQRYQTISNALTASHQAAMNSVRNMK